MSQGFGVASDALRTYARNTEPDAERIRLIRNRIRHLEHYAAYKEAKSTVNAVIVAPVVGQDVAEPIQRAYDEYAPGNAPGVTPREATAYDQRPESQSFGQRMSTAETATQQKVWEDFG